MILRPAPTATTTASRRCLPRECARSPSARRRRRSGSGPPWPLSEPPSSSGVGYAQDATNGTCRSVTYVIVATGSVPRRVSSRAVFPDPRRDEQGRDESDSDDSAAIDLRRGQEEDLEETVMPFLRSTRTKRGSGSKKRSNLPGWKGKFPKPRNEEWRSSVAWCRCGCVHLPRHRPGARPRSPPPAAAARRERGTLQVCGRKAQPLRPSG